MQNDIDSALDDLKKKDEFTKRFPDYPCTRCKVKVCGRKPGECVKWCKWFSEEWKKIKKILKG